MFDIRACPSVVQSGLVRHTGNDQLSATCDRQDSVFILQHGYAQLCKNRQPALDPEIIFVIAGYPVYAIPGLQITKRRNVVLQFIRGTVDHIAGNSHQVGREGVGLRHYVPEPGTFQKRSEVNIGKLDNRETVQAHRQFGQGDLYRADIRNAYCLPGSVNTENQSGKYQSNASNRG